MWQAESGKTIRSRGIFFSLSLSLSFSLSEDWNDVGVCDVEENTRTRFRWGNGDKVVPRGEGNCRDQSEIWFLIRFSQIVFDFLDRWLSNNISKQDYFLRNRDYWTILWRGIWLWKKFRDRFTLFFFKRNINFRNNG